MVVTGPDTEREDVRLCDLDGGTGTLNFDRSLGFDDPAIGPEAERCDDLLGERSRIGRSLGLAGSAAMKGFFILGVDD